MRTTPPTPSGPPTPVTILPLTGIPEVREGDALVDAIEAGLVHAGVQLRDGDIVVVASKIASKSLGLVTHDVDKERVIAGETEYVVAERSSAGKTTRVVRSKAGPVMAAAGVDGSNTGELGGWLLLPRDPDTVCEALHEELTRRYGARLGVVLSDTSSRPWRVGQSDFALGAHGVQVTDDLRGGVDADGRPLEVTTRAVADEIAAAADLVKGKVHAVPAAVVRGLSTLVPDVPDSNAPRARDLVRTGPDDWFGYGRVEAVRAALGVEPGTDVAKQVGVPPTNRAESSVFDRLARAVRAALVGVDSGTAEVDELEVTLRADTPFELGRLSVRLEAALWSEGLQGERAEPGSDGTSLTVTVAPKDGPAAATHPVV
jgi:coenzyme F420-0:L-glutamate ligase/coenzyme F420-1:gamma-L-glutamate ligase